jgi:hypothetical protein
MKIETSTEDAWIDVPPSVGINGKVIDLKPFSERISASVSSALKRIGGDSPDHLAIGAYLIAAGREPFEAAKILQSPEASAHFEAEILAMSEDDFGLVMAYINRVIERRNLSAVEVASSPGK